MYPTQTLTPGTTSAEVKKLQNFLISQGISIPAGATGYYGDQTKSAVAQWQKAKGVDAGADFGYWGPKSVAVASNPASVINNPVNTAVSQSGTAGQTFNENAQTAADIAAKQKAIETQSASHPVLSKYGKWEDALSAVGGDITKMTDQYGTPFSEADQTQAMNDASSALDPYYSALTTKDTGDTEAALAKDTQDYNNYLTSSATDFQNEKVKADQTAADQGVLFSGGRVQKQKQLESAYANDQTSKLNALTNNISNAARDFQYKYGNTNATNPALSKYYTAGGNTYDAGVAGGGIGSAGLSTIYNPATSNFQGTNINAAKAAKQQRAAGLLWNKANKLTGANTTY